MVNKAFASKAATMNARHNSVSHINFKYMVVIVHV